MKRELIPFHSVYVCSWGFKNKQHFLELIMPRGLGSFNHISTFLDESLGVVWMMFCCNPWMASPGSSSKVDAPALQPGVPRCEVFQFFDIKKSQDMRQKRLFLIFFTIFSFTPHFRKSKKAGVRINSNWFHLGSLLVGLGWRRNPRISLLSTTPRCFPADFNSHPEKFQSLSTRFCSCELNNPEDLVKLIVVLKGY